MSNENETPQPPAGSVQERSDRRVFLISFLTAVIVVIAYHFITIICSFFCGEDDYMVTQSPKYMLVPVAQVQMGDGMGMGRGGGPRMGMGNRERGPRQRGDFQRRGPGGMKQRGMDQQAPAEEQKTPAEEKPATEKPVETPAE